MIFRSDSYYLEWIINYYNLSISPNLQHMVNELLDFPIPKELQSEKPEEVDSVKSNLSRRYSEDYLIKERFLQLLNSLD